MSYSTLRPVRHKSARAHVAHIFDDDNYWWPYRSALCGREIEGSQLTGERMHVTAVCVQCERRLAALAEDCDDEEEELVAA